MAKGKWQMYKVKGKGVILTFCHFPCTFTFCLFTFTIEDTMFQRFTPDANMPVMSRDEVRSVDQWAIKTMGIPGVVLMENAGRTSAEFILTKLGWHGQKRSVAMSAPLVAIFCGAGNNGGDGFVVARHLYNAGIRTRVIICGNAAKIKGDAKINLDIITKMGISIEELSFGIQALAGLSKSNTLVCTPNKDIEKNVIRFAEGANLLVDGLFGTGLQGRLDDNYISLISAINGLGIPIIAIDIPSGLDCDAGVPLGAAIKAVATITFVAAKKGFSSPASADYTGEIYVAGIGIEPKSSM
jgi:NAD(P)H-hydrate epimerase